MNHLLSALMPTHAALTTAAEQCLVDHSPSFPSLPSVQTERLKPVPGSRGKYIIVERQGLELAIIFHASVSHSDAVNRKDCPPVSAGFYWLNSNGSVSTDEQGSTSLSLKPRPEDADIIADTLRLLGLLQ